MRIPIAVLVVAGLLAGSSDAAAQWTSVGSAGAPARTGQTLTWQTPQAVVAITVVSADVIRVRVAPGRTFKGDRSFAVIGQSPGDPAATFEVGADHSIVHTASLVVTVQQRPLRIAVADTAGHTLTEDDPRNGMAVSGSTLRVWKRLPDDTQIYGLGEKTGRLNKRGRQLGGYSVTMWNSDTFAYEADTDPIYATIPFYLALNHGVAHGVFLDNTFRSNFDVGHQTAGLLSFGADGGELNYYVIAGPTPKQVVGRYTDLTGRMPLPPLWSLGYHQCRYSYYPDRTVRFIAENFRVRKIPADTLWLDVHYLDGYAPFTWDAERFPDPARLVKDLAADGFRLVTIIDPHIKKQSGSAPYDSGVAGGHFVKNPDGSIYEGPVWPSRAERNPAPSVFPDFTRAATREWWGGLYRDLTTLGVAGIWNDMNEPAVFDNATGTMPLDVRHDNDGAPTDQREIHNVYGQLMTRGTYEGLLRLRPDERPFVLTRATYAGGQRYAAAWPGDNVSDWSAMRGAIPTLLGMGLSGLPFVGVDIGGFAENPSPELYTRWLQSGLLYPFMRSHTVVDSNNQEPWSFGAPWESINRRVIELRYELLPTIYNIMHESSETGLPAMRPLMLEFPDDGATYGLDDEYLFGPNLLVAPVLREGASTRSVYLPGDAWFDFHTGRRYEGGTTHSLPVTLSSLPLFVRAGTILFRQPVVQHTGQMPGQPLTLEVYPAPNSEATLYEDDGHSLAYRTDAFLRRTITQTRQEATSTSPMQARIAIGAGTGAYRPEGRSLRVAVLWPGRPACVTVDGTSIQAVEEGAATPATTGWWIDQRGFVVVAMPDRFAGPVVVGVEN